MTLFSWQARWAKMMSHEGKKIALECHPTKSELSYLSTNTAVALTVEYFRRQQTALAY